MRYCLSLLVTTLAFASSANNELDQGPGLFSGQDGEFKLVTTNKKQSENLPEYTQKQEFELYKQWLMDKQKGTENYKEFKLWLAFNALKNG